MPVVNTQQIFQNGYMLTATGAFGIRQSSLTETDLTTVIATVAAIPTGKATTRQILAGSGTYVAPAGVVAQHVWGQGGGAGGGGALQGTATAAGSGGAAGGFADVWIPSGTNPAVLTNVAYSCGAGGAAGTYAPSDGGAGGDTTFGSVLKAKGGLGGSASSGNAVESHPGGSGTLTGAIGDLVGAGQRGGLSQAQSTSILQSGCGGNAPFGIGGDSISSRGDGNAASGYGAGGGGGVSQSPDTGRNGGAGMPGIIIVEEFYL